MAFEVLEVLRSPDGHAEDVTVLEVLFHRQTEQLGVKDHPQIETAAVDH